MKHPCFHLFWFSHHHNKWCYVFIWSIWFCSSAIKQLKSLYIYVACFVIILIKLLDFATSGENCNVLHRCVAAVLIFYFKYISVIIYTRHYSAMRIFLEFKVQNIFWKIESYNINKIYLYLFQKHFTVLLFLKSV